MKKITMILGIVALLASCNKGVDKHPKLATEIDSASYSLGLLIGSDIAKNSPEDQKLIQNLVFSGLAAGFDQDSTASIKKEDAIRIWNTFLKKQHEAQQKKAKEKLEKRKETEKKFLEENKEKAGVITTDSGLQYEIIKQGEGKIPEKGDKVSVHYVGTFLDGKEFDSSKKHDKPFEFEVGEGRVIKGWDEALQLMPVGSKWKIYLPYELAYGERQMRTIPACSLLIFEVELLEIKEK